MKRLLYVFFAAALVVFVGASQLFAQSQGSVRGSVQDPQGSFVLDAKVTLTNVGTNTRQETTTNAEGLFVFAYVTPAVYEVSVQKDGFRKSTARVTVEVAQTVNLNLRLELGNITETVTVTESATIINTTNGELAHEVSGKQLQDLPLLNRNYYNLMQLTPGAADTGTVSGDTRGSNMAGGGGLAIGGARTSSINFMLDGGENNDTFVAGVGQLVPLDAVQEFKIQTNGATAEYGRNPVVTNAVTKSGTNSYHGSAYEYYRGAALSTATFVDKSNELPKSNFVRNQFGGSFGGPIKKDKLFYFGSMESVRVRSSSNQLFYVPTQAFLDNATPDVNSYMSTFGGLPSSNCASSPLTAAGIWDDTEGNRASNGSSTYNTDPANGLFNANTGAKIAGDTQLFCRTAITVPTDSGGGAPQNTWLATGRVDYNFSPNTNFFARYGFQKSDNPVGAGSFSPYSTFNTGQNLQNQNATAVLTHSFSPSLFGELRATYNRVNAALPLGKEPPTTPCWQYNNSNFGSTPTGDLIVFPGYLPTQCSFAGLDTGGPQNVYQVSGSATKQKGRHTFKFGANYFHMRFNYRFGAYENGYYESETMNDMLAGVIGFLEQAVDPRGHVPGEQYCAGTSPCDVTVNGNPATIPADGPLVFPSFTRHYHYNEWALFGEDTYKLTQRLTVTYGLRWEYFGVPHSPGNERFLDANLYLNAVGAPTNNLFEQIATSRFRRTNQFYRPDYSDFGPRLGLAYDFSGTGRTVLRAGYGMYYDRNFGNATFNAIQNPPNYAVLANTPDAFFGDTVITVKPNEFDILSQGSGAFTISSSARMLDNDVRAPRIQQWNATIEHNLFGKGLITSVSYIGSHADFLYSLNNLNMRGSCLLLVEAVPTAPCNPAAGNPSRINQSGLSSMNRRSNEAYARYHAFALDVRSQQLGNTGLTVNGTFTLAHSIDNESSFFADSLFEGNWGFGFKSPFQPGLDRASSTNDIRNRGTIAAVWDVPWKRNDKGVFGQIVGGWGIAGIFVAQTGAAFSVFDGSTSGQCSLSGTNFCYPVETSTGTIPHRQDTDTGNPNSFTLYDLNGAPFQTQANFCANNSLVTPLGTFGGGAGVGAATPFNYTASQDRTACTAALNNLHPELMSNRNLFRTPGIWTVDTSVHKNFHMPWEGHELQFRADFLNLFNHANLYADPVTNVFTGSSSSAVLGHRGQPNCAPVTCGNERRNIQLSLRYSF